VNHTAGVFVDSNTAMSLAVTVGGGSIFQGWTGDTSGTANPLVLSPVKRGYIVTAVFSAALVQASGTPPDPVMGKPYSFNLTATGGSGTYTWTQTGGVLPTGMSLAANGAITGIPEQAGPFSINVRVTSAPQTADGTVSFTVTEPTLVLANVLGGLLGTGGTLSADERTYLDLIGNKNNAYDVGDYLAWVEKTGATPPSAPLVVVVPPGEPWIPPYEDP
jgi:hypothetical protein